MPKLRSMSPAIQQAEASRAEAACLAASPLAAGRAALIEDAGGAPSARATPPSPRVLGIAANYTARRWDELQWAIGGAAAELLELMDEMARLSQALALLRPGSPGSLRVAAEITHLAGQAAGLVAGLQRHGHSPSLSAGPCHPAQAATRVVRALQSLVPEEISVHSDISGPLPPLAIDPAMLEQVLMTQAMSAVERFRSGRGCLSLTARLVSPDQSATNIFAAAEMAVEFEVADDAPYHGSGAPRTPRSPETGSGQPSLSEFMIQILVRHARGTVRWSWLPGGGTAMIIKFPLADFTLPR